MAATDTGTTAISQDNYAFLQEHVYRTSGIVLDGNKHYLLEARLLPIVRREELKTLNDLCALLRASGSGRVFQDVRDAMTTNETLFFRDALPFKAMRQTLIPRLRESRTTGRLTFWSAAASSGQEAYSLAMMLLDMGIKGSDIDILATDISDKVLDQAKSGRYSQTEVGRGLPAQQLVKYFQRDKAEWQIKDELRRLVRFQPFDLRAKMSSIGRFDFILCRNVLIYFDVETKKRIFREMENALNPGGFLLLGAAETTLNITDSFERCSVEGVSFYRKR
ncbi:MAG TPA: protein-glutamate O-methyltransferase CheR [Bryobacteraceae bacterium]|jgi:chemotaxis protein methyltransferase CheR|nr:protein-glutamate O-methyltransferase CheR [Bryobacteraceae bacterium]